MSKKPFTSLDKEKLNLMLYIVIACLLTTPSKIFSQYVPPIGIPAPGFGINETVDNLYGSGYYTYWVNNLDSNASNTLNGNGTPSAPLADMFKGGSSITLEAGDVMVIEGGPYYKFTGDRAIIANGTAENPVIIRGSDPDNRVEWQGDGNSRLYIRGSYFIIENIDMSNGIRVKLDNYPDHISFRNNELHADGVTVTYNPAFGGGGEDIVIYKSYLHDYWRIQDGEPYDCHGINPGLGSMRWWILENVSHGFSGDSFQALHNASANPPKFIYIGKNVFHDDYENAVDLKYAEDVIVSQNIAYGYENANTSDGSAMIIGSDGGPKRAWFLYNEIFDCVNGIRTETSVDSAWIIGNVIHDLSGSAFPLQKNGPYLNIIGNTVYNVQQTIDQYWQEDFVLYVYNNIFANIGGESDGNILNIESSNVYANSHFENNLFWQDGNTVVLNLGHGGNTESYEQCDSTGDFTINSFGNGNIIADPLFTNTANADFSIPVNSPVVDAGKGIIALNTYYSLYGIDIGYDISENYRPQGNAWDIGAYEYLSGGHPPAQFILSEEISGLGSIQLSPSGGIYDSATVVTVTAVPDQWQQFNSWGGDLSGSSNPTTITMNSSKNITASFSEQSGAPQVLSVDTVWG